jgi:hypothetical protein
MLVPRPLFLLFISEIPSGEFSSVSRIYNVPLFDTALDTYIEFYFMRLN